MSWTKPALIEVFLGMEINAYAGAEIADLPPPAGGEARLSAPRTGGPRLGEQSLERSGA